MIPFEKYRPWVKPGLTSLLGLILLFHPGSVSSLLGAVAGYAISLVGAYLLISFFFGAYRDGLRLAAAIILVVLGFSIIRNPLSLTSQLGRFIGVLLVLQSVRELMGQKPMKNKTLSIITGVVGVVLMLVPMAASHLLISGCGLVVLGVGISMLVEVYRYQHRSGHDDRIIDAR